MVAGKVVEPYVPVNKSSLMHIASRYWGHLQARPKLSLLLPQSRKSLAAKTPGTLLSRIDISAAPSPSVLISMMRSEPDRVCRISPALNGPTRVEPECLVAAQARVGVDRAQHEIVFPPGEVPDEVPLRSEATVGQACEDEVVGPRSPAQDVGPMTARKHVGAVSTRLLNSDPNTHLPSSLGGKRQRQARLPSRPTKLEAPGGLYLHLDRRGVAYVTGKSRWRSGLWLRRSPRGWRTRALCRHRG